MAVSTGKTRRSSRGAATTRTAQVKVAPERKEEAVEETKSSYIFFNCDDFKSQASMNVFYNHAVYADTKKSRKLLLAKIKSEVEANRVHIDEAKWPDIERAVVDGNPEDANSLLAHGNIFRIDSF